MNEDVCEMVNDAMTLLFFGLEGLVRCGTTTHEEVEEILSSGNLVGAYKEHHKTIRMNEILNG